MSLFSSLFKSKKEGEDKGVSDLFNVDAKPIDKGELIKSKGGVLNEKNHPKEKLPRDEADEKNEKDNEEEDSSESDSESELESQQQPKKPRAKKDENENLESEYFKKLLGDETEPKPQNNPQPNKKAQTIDLKETELQKAEKTIFVGNVPVSAVTSKSTYKQFKNLFSKIGDIASIRFRSIAFNEALPRKIAFSQKKFHDKKETLNAYIVYESKEVSLKAPEFYNTKVFENCHLRVDHVAHPAPKDNKRTIFVGNLDFEEMEETLWKYFNDKCGNDVESVRIVRDSKTNIGKGFALVQFKDSLSVNKALLLNDKPISKEKSRKLRISRAKAHTKPSILSPNHMDNQKKNGSSSKLVNQLSDKQRSKLGRSKVLGRADKATAGRKVIVEGERAKKGGINKKKKPRITNRSRTFKRAALNEAKAEGKTTRDGTK